MSNTTDPQLLAQAGNPATPAEELQSLATNPQLRPVIARNPSAYTGLLDWMAKKNEPAVNAALLERLRDFNAGQQMPMPTVPVAGAATDTDKTVNPDEERPTPATTQMPTRNSIIGTSGVEETTVLSPLEAGVVAGAVAGNALGEALPAAYAPDQTPFSSATAANGVYASAGAAATVGGAAYGAAPASYQYHETPSEEASSKNSNAGLWVIFGALLAAVIILGVVIAMLFSSDNTAGDAAEGSANTSPSADGATPQETPEESPSEEPSETPSEEPSEKETLAPAPADAYTMSAFSTLTGNTYCAISGDTLTCEIQEHEVPILGCGPGTPVIVSFDGNTVTPQCAQGQISSSPNLLQYGESIAIADYACTSRTDGTTCWNTVTGKGFFLARQEYREEDYSR